MTMTMTATGVLALRNLRHSFRQPAVWAVSLTMPIIFIVMFDSVFGGAVAGSLPPGAAGEYVNWLVPGLIAQFVVFHGAGTAAGIAEDLTGGTMDRLRSLPTSRLAVLAGRTTSDAVTSAATILVMLTVGTLLGFRWQTDPLRVLAALGVALALGYGMSWVMVLVGLVVRSAEAVTGAVYMIVFPLGFTSAVFVPVQTMPGWLRPFAEHQPVTAAADAVRGLMLGPAALAPGETVGSQTVIALAWAAGLTLVFAPLATRVFSRPVA